MLVVDPRFSRANVGSTKSGRDVRSSQVLLLHDALWSNANGFSIRRQPKGTKPFSASLITPKLHH